MAKAVHNKNKCKGCFLCVNVCPKQALYDSGEINEKGYKLVALDPSKCIGCGACYRICPDYAFELRD